MEVREAAETPSNEVTIQPTEPIETAIRPIEPTETAIPASEAIESTSPAEPAETAIPPAEQSTNSHVEPNEASKKLTETPNSGEGKESKKSEESCSLDLNIVENSSSSEEDVNQQAQRSEESSD